jgi:hypothetical protein
MGALLNRKSVEVVMRWLGCTYTGAEIVEALESEHLVSFAKKKGISLELIYEWSIDYKGLTAEQINRLIVHGVEHTSSVSASILLTNLFLLPFRLLWNLVVTVVIVTAFVLWFGFIFGSVIAVVLILIFASHLFLLPIALGALYIKIWD